MFPSCHAHCCTTLLTYLPNSAHANFLRKPSTSPASPSCLPLPALPTSTLYYTPACSNAPAPPALSLPSHCCQLQARFPLPTAGMCPLPVSVLLPWHAIPACHHYRTFSTIFIVVLLIGDRCALFARAMAALWRSGNIMRRGSMPWWRARRGEKMAKPGAHRVAAAA